MVIAWLRTGQSRSTAAGQLTDTEVLGTRLKKRVLLDLGTLAGEGRRGRLLCGLIGLGLVIETRQSAWLSGAQEKPPPPPCARSSNARVRSSRTNEHGPSYNPRVIADLARETAQRMKWAACVWDPVCVKPSMSVAARRASSKVMTHHPSKSLILTGSSRASQARRRLTTSNGGLPWSFFEQCGR